ncbi:TetR/AcrR family transcriptional regulator [Prauserella cavernicola]|uniref:TetR family transcriptional regulator C-terminal domain-containing protein n=1 Tax=Prauserella cavernicola TaxID=2800127 RepID=A0A934QVQ9_9PSEU|nr:TetR family transcriptional regulator C-terminal domain-containing protein [Prauserella cavernicola]MBK1787431.1 TetR family transcriptional regulator C-terminal domain-containing protein [Prauserella cavernicola]
MPKRVDHEERRRQVASALLRVAARDGLEAVSLRHVAEEVGVTAGLVQHYFPNKDAMLRFAMATASERYERRVDTRIAALAPDPSPAEVIEAILGCFIPRGEPERQEARVALAFQSYASRRPDVATDLATQNAKLSGFLESRIALARRDDSIDPATIATALLATAEGLAVHVLSARLTPETALGALRAQLALVVDTGRPDDGGGPRTARPRR